MRLLCLPGHLFTSFPEAGGLGGLKELGESTLEQGGVLQYLIRNRNSKGVLHCLILGPAIQNPDVEHPAESDTEPRPQKVDQTQGLNFKPPLIFSYVWAQFF
ncbi:NADH dehydrogenase [Platysternon megacephalum]|uniref:NADH dehydrogenase n=1 Tax=Platysternon megacephalum TaxID=55544 RepID=A0A4D9ERH2_9SAUR|nr:NADH dehydrogenase [Platysternon megacephalum]